MGRLYQTRTLPKPKNKDGTGPKPDFDLKSCKWDHKSPKFNFDTKAPIEFDFVHTYTFTSTILQNKIVHTE